MSYAVTIEHAMAPHSWASNETERGSPAPPAYDDQVSDIQQQFWQLVDRERGRAIALAYHLCGDRQAAEDIAQEAFCKAHKNLARFRGEAALSTWFTRILINEAKSYRRRHWLRQRWQRIFGEEQQNSHTPIQAKSVGTPEQAAWQSQIQHHISRALDKLSPGQRAVFSMVHLEGMSIAEAATVLEIAPGTAKSHLHRSFCKMRIELSELEEHIR